MWLCKLFGHKYHQFMDGMRVLYCERCAHAIKPAIADNKGNVNITNINYSRDQDLGKAQG